MNSHRGTAYVLAVAIYAGNREKVDVEETSDRIYKAINTCPDFATDEAKADVYAQLAESLKADTPFKEAVELIEKAMYQTALALHYHG